MIVKDIFCKYDKKQLIRIKDYLNSEIDNDTLNETVSFINSKPESREKEFQDILFTSKKYKGCYLDGNQYILNERLGKVEIIDVISEENRVDKNYTRIEFSVEEFLFIINNKKIVMKELLSMG
ncbi:MAG: hypothetical protein ACK5LC_08890 [Coprobacillaceae bacterium]